MTDPKPNPPELHALAEAPDAVLWEQGPVEQPAEPLPDLVTGSPATAPAIPAPDPAFAAVVVERPEEEPLLEVDTGDLEALPRADESGAEGEVVSLESLLATPPPANAEALAPIFPPPLRQVSRPPAVEPGPFVPGAPLASRSFVSGDHRVVLHMAEGQVLRGSLGNADLADAELPLVQPNGAIARVPAAQVKAVFFMLPAGERPPVSSGTRVRVTFADGRQVSGLSPDYTSEAAGFFVLPLDVRTHTSRVWVYRSAIQHLSVG